MISDENIQINLEFLCRWLPSNDLGKASMGIDYTEGGNFVFAPQVLFLQTHPCWKE